jgi:membrane-associated protease RseP (regulator of RpoE activity)
MPAIVALQLLLLHLLLTVPHELSHYVVARALRVSVPEFGIGLPPALVAVRVRGTRWSINALPIGAFVAYELPASADASRRRLIAFAGPAGNLLIAFACLIALGLLDTGGPENLAFKTGQHVASGLGSFWVAYVLPLLGLSVPIIEALARPWSGLVEFLRLLLAASIAVAVFNLLPIPPLDGSKLLDARCASPRRSSAQRWIGRLALAGVVILSCVGTIALSLAAQR